MIDSIRQMHHVATDPYSGGRNFVNHFSVPKWNVTPINSPIEVQYAIAIGTGVAQARHGGSGITIVTGGDAGTAEGEFASCMVWASRQKRELPILMIVTNNSWGISTAYEEVHCKAPIAQRADGFGIRNAVVDGNDANASWIAISEAMHYVRTARKPFLLEARVSRLYGHSSASGANRIPEPDCLERFEKELLQEKVIQKDSIKKIRDTYEKESREALTQVLQEPKPDPQTLFENIWQP